MPTVLVLAQEISSRLFIKDEKELENLCFDYGLEYDGSELDTDSKRLYYRIEVPANRCDLLSVEGICRAFRVFKGLESVPTFRLHPSHPSSCMTIRVEPAVAKIRPYCFGAVLRGVNFTETSFKSFIDLQDKLHHTVARKRRLVAIGTHDLSTLKGPFVYDAVDPKAITFIPLSRTETVDGHGLMELLSTHAQLKAYLPIIRDSPVYPVIRDSRSVVLSVPPIINGDHSKITLNTRDVFIEVTATDQTKGLIVLNALVCTFSEYCSTPFTVEPVRVEYAEGHLMLGRASFVNPIFETRYLTTTVDYVSRVTGIPKLTAPAVCSLLARMMLDGKADADNQTLKITVPVLRPDVLHPCDVAEDVAIAFGYNRIAACAFAAAQELPTTALANRLRSEIACCGYHETLTWGLCSLKEGFEYFGLLWDTEQKQTEQSLKVYDPFGTPVRLSNPKTKEFEMVRTSLFPGLLKTLAANAAQELPLKLFEIGDCVTLDTASETGGRTRRYCAALVANHSGSGLEVVHGLLDCILHRLGLAAVYDESLPQDETTSVKKALGSTKRIYSLVPQEEPGLCLDSTFLPKRSVHIVVQPDNVVIGRMGVVHPSVLKHFGSTLPCAAFEISLVPFLNWLSPTELY